MNPELEATLLDWLANGTDVQKQHAKYRLNLKSMPPLPSIPPAPASVPANTGVGTGCGGCGNKAT